MSTATIERRTRKPTGIPPWPTILIAGGEKSGKSWSAAQFSGSELVGQTFYIEIGEHYADEYGRIPGARYVIVEHDGTYRDILATVQWAVAQPRVDDKPNCVILDSATVLWDMLSTQAHRTAYGRWRKKNPNLAEPEEEVQVTQDLWNKAKERFAEIIKCLYRHDGPTIVTARLEQVSVVVGGKPTNEKAWKVQAEKRLPFEVDVVIQAREPRTFQVTGLRSTELELPVGKSIPLPGFTVDGFLRKLGLDKVGATAPRSVTPLRTDEKPEPEQPLRAHPDDVRTLNIRIKDKFGPIPDAARIGKVAGFIRRPITSTSDVFAPECAAMLRSLAGLPDYAAPTAPQPSPVPLSVQQSESPEAIAEAQALLPLLEADEADRVESSLRDLLESAGSPEELRAAWLTVEARQSEGRIGAVHVSALRQVYELRVRSLAAEYERAVAARQPQEAGAS